MAYLSLSDKTRNLNVMLKFFFCIFLPVIISGELCAEIMLLKDIRPGMQGIGKTVIHGREIATFGVEILGILSNNKINENILITGRSILVKTSGQVIDKAGGIAAGMSGSPIYIDGKIIGGLSSGWVMTDHTVGMVTPIEEMMEIWDYPMISMTGDSSEAVCWSSDCPVKIEDTCYNRFWEVSDPNSLPPEICMHEPVFARISNPIMVQGITGNSFERLKSRFKSRNMCLTQQPNISDNFGDETIGQQENAEIPSIEPGSAIGVQLARGDINLTTLGTLTYRSGRRILAFAHPFLKKGSVSFLLTGAHIYHCFSSVQMPFKMGEPTEMIGMITQDREKGLAGELGRFPDMVPIQLDVTDKDLKRSKSINFQVVKTPSVFTSVIESTLMQALEGIIDREGQGTALLGISLECANNTGKTFNFRRENLFYSKSDIVNTIIVEVTNLLDMIIESDLEEVYPTRLLLKVEIERKRRTMNIEKVEVKNTSITTGGILEVWVNLRPFRDKPIVRKAKLPIPQDIGRDTLILTVFGLNSRLDEMDTVDTKEIKIAKEQKSEEAVPDDFDGSIRSWVNSPKNSDLLFQLSVEGEETKKVQLNGKDAEIQPTNMVVVGRVDTTITLSEE